MTLVEELKYAVRIVVTNMLCRGAGYIILLLDNKYKK
jgi:hypothetical protein